MRILRMINYSAAEARCRVPAAKNKYVQTVKSQLFTRLTSYLMCNYAFWIVIEACLQQANFFAF